MAVAFVPVKENPPDTVFVPESNVLNVTRVFVVLPNTPIDAFIDAFDVCKRIAVLTVVNSMLPVTVANAELERLARLVFKPILLFVPSNVSNSVWNVVLPVPILSAKAFIVPTDELPTVRVL